MIHYRTAILKENKQDPAYPIKLFYSSMGNFPLHWHDSLEIIVVLDGTIDIKVNDSNYHLKFGDILFINSRDLHSFDKNDKNKNRIFILQIEPSFFSRSSLKSEIPISPVKIFNKQKHFQKGDKNYYLINSQLERIMSEFDNKEDSFLTSISVSLLEIYLIFIRLIKNDNKEISIIPKIERLRNVVAYVDENFINPITLSDAAESACLSVFHFSRIFKNYTGLTFFDYLKSYRITYAEYLLLSTDQSITDIAFLCGYTNLKTFNRQFQSIEGASPSLYRKKNS